MSLIKVENIGFGLSGTELELTIAIPKDDYLYSFRIYNQKDVQDSKCSSDIGTDYIAELEKSGYTTQEAFNQLFERNAYTPSYTDVTDGKEYYVYTLKKDAPIKSVSQKDITFISMSISDAIADNCSDTKLTVPLFNLTPMRLTALEAAKGIKDDCNVPRIFLNKLLQIKAIEVALCCNAYCDAAKYWIMFYSEEGDKSVKKCGCHGGVA